MKAASGKGETKKRKRDDSQESISESPKRTKVHAQRKFAQGAAFNSPVITPIKDKTRPTTSVSTPGPMLTSKRPNTEDFLTFLCFRRTSILPPKLDFFKDAAGNQNSQGEQTPSTGNQKSNEQPSKNKSSKAVEKKDDKKKEEKNKKNQVPAVQALRKKYQEQRLAKQKPMNVTKLAQKVKGKNMMRTRSTTVVEEKKPITKKAPEKVKATPKPKPGVSGLRSGLQRVQQQPNKKIINKPVKTNKNKNLRSGLRSGGTGKSTEKEISENKLTPTATKKAEPVKKVKIDAAETPVRRTKKPEGLSDFSSDDNEPLLAVKKPKPIKEPKKPVKEEKQAAVKTRSKNIERDTPTQRPTRKTKEAAAIYMEMITKKLVSPDKSGDDDISSVDSFPELPNAKRNEQRESEIKAKALATKKGIEQKKAVLEEKVKEVKKVQQKKMEVQKKEVKKEESPSRKNVKKEVKGEEKNESVKKVGKKEEGKAKEEKEKSVSRPSTRSKSHGDVEFRSKTIDELSLKKSKMLVKKAVQKRTGAKIIPPAQPVKKAKLVKSKEDLAKKKKELKKEKEGAKKVVKKKMEGKKEEKKEKVEEKVEKAKLEKEEKVDKVTKVEKEAKLEEKKKVEKGKEEKVEEKKKVDKVTKLETEDVVVEKKKVEKISKAEKEEKVEEKKKVEKGKEEKAEEKKKIEKVEEKKKVEKLEKKKVEKLEEKKKVEKLEEKKKVEKVEEKKKVEKAEEKNKVEKGSKVEKEGKTGKKEKVEKLEKKEKPAEVEKKDEPTTSKRPTRKCSTVDKIWIDIDGFTSDEEDFVDVRSITTNRSSKKDETPKQETKKKTKAQNQKESTGKKKPKKGDEKEEEIKKKKETEKETKAKEGAVKKKDEKTEKKAESEEQKDEGKQKGDEEKKEPKKRKTQNKDDDKSDKSSRNLRERFGRRSITPEKSVRRTRPIRQCSTGDKMWIESDDSFDFYASSDEEDHLPIVDVSKKDPVKSTPTVEKPAEEKPTKDCDNFSESDEEPLKKKTDVKPEEVSKPPPKPMPDLHPIAKKSPEKTPEKPQTQTPKLLKSPITDDSKNSEIKSEISINRQEVSKQEISDFREKIIPEIPVVASVPNRIEMILQTLKSDKRMETVCTSNISPPIIANPKITYQIPQSVVCTFPPRNLQRPREPINTHGLDLLSEVALPTSKDITNLQTERIEKWLKDSLAVEKKETFPAYEDVKYKTPTKPEPVVYQVPKASHQELRKFEQMEIMESQKMKRKPETPKKTVTSVQDLLKLQKERKEVPKPFVDNTPHSKNCKCNSCVVKKGWFKNKPIPKEEMKISPTDHEKPFESLSKAFSPKMSVSVAPIVHATTSTMTMTKSPDKKPIFQQRKLSFLERMKERERKEALVKANPNAFSPNNESSVYAFEPEPEQTVPPNTPFRSKRDSRTSSTNTSRSEEDILKICEDEVSSQVSSGTQVEKKQDKISKISASIAVQVNLDNEGTTQVEAIPEMIDGKSIEISTQTEVPEEDSDSPMFYIPLQQSTSTATASDQQLIQGVALKLGTEGPMGPNQRVIMKAKLVTKPPDTPSMKAVVMPQPKRIFDQKSNNPPVGTVQPTTRKPPEILSDESNTNSDIASTPKRSSGKMEPEFVSQASTDSGMGSEVCSLKTNLNSPSSSKGLKTKSVQSGSKEKFDFSDESSPGSSKSKSKTKQKSSESVINPSNSTWLPPPGTPSKLVEAPTFHPTEKEFQDPLEFFDRIRPAAEKFGLCRIVPPSNFKPDCKVTDDMRFTAYNQYVHRMLHRWGPNVKEMMAIKKYLATQSISLKQPPWIGGIEVDLPRLYQSVQNCGGLMKVMEKKKWHQVADMMKIPKAAQDRVTKLDDIYCKYLLPYDTLSHDERQKLFEEVEKDWLDRQKTSEESQENQNEDESEEENYIEECEECVVKGRNMALNQFYRIARNTMSMWFKNSEPSPTEVENEFWKHVTEKNHHVCVHSGSIDSSGWGYGFPIGKNNTFSKHPWNLKVLTNNSGSVLRSLGPLMGVTVPTLHVGMVFTAFCWYRDPHGLPWIEYLHTGAPKKWYGISDDNSAVFREALTKLLPRYIKNKKIWLPSDTAMVPPSLLVEHGVSLCHTVQEPGQFILVFPRAFTSSICTGYLVSESVYFAQPSWLTTAEQVFKDIQDSCEPTMFSLEKLLFNIANDSRSSVEILKQVLPMVWHIRQKEIDGRKTLFNLGLKSSERLPVKESGSSKKKGRWAQDDDGDYECEICRTNLFVSLVTNSHEEGVYCLPHAIELLTQKRHHLKYCKLMYSYSQEEMNELVEKLEQKIENKTQKKLQGKSSTSTK